MHIYDQLQFPLHFPIWVYRKPECPICNKITHIRQKTACTPELEIVINVIEFFDYIRLWLLTTQQYQVVKQIFR